MEKIFSKKAVEKGKRIKDNDSNEVFEVLDCKQVFYEDQLGFQLTIKKVEENGRS